MSEIKVFLIGDHDWWVGTDAESCKQSYVQHYGLVRADDFDEEIEELSPSDMKRLKYIEDGQPDISFQERLEKIIAEGIKFPCMFASTEF